MANVSSRDLYDNDGRPRSWLVPVSDAYDEPEPSSEQPVDLVRLRKEIDLWSKPAPEGASGHDPSGLAQVDISRVRRPLRLVLKDHWRTRISPGGLGGAVLAAYHDATRRQFEAAKREFWARPQEPEEDEPTFDEAVLRPYLGGSPRLPENYLEDIAGAIQRYHEADWALGNQEPPSSPKAKGPEGAKVRLLLEDSRLTGCEIDSDWAAERTAAQIMNEFSRTLVYLREQGETARAEEPDGPEAERKAALAELEELAHEGVAALRAMLND